MAQREQRALLSNLSHDIKSPLTTIRGHAQVLRRHVERRGDAPPPDRLVAGLAQIESSALRLAGLLDDLEELAGLDAGNTPPLHPRPADLLTVARGAVDRHQRLAERHQLILETTVDSLEGNWDVPRLERMLDNLLANAIKYSPEGGTITVRLALSTPLEPTGGPERAEVAGMIRPADLGALLTVADCGIGIAPADLPYVFERFRRGTNVGETIPGSGIGLTSVRHIVEQHGGTVGVASREGEGTTVSVWLPLKPPSDEASGGDGDA